jgi:RNA polymerase sigma-70 factor (ECF subfamily)
MSDLSDEALMSKVQAGQTSCLELLVTRYQQPLYAFAYRVMGRSTAAEDAFQETFLKVFRNRASYKTGAPFRPWVYQICLNICRDQLRKDQRRPEAELKPELPVLDPSPGPEELSAQSDTSEKIRRAVESLPEKQQEVFVLSYYQSLSYPEIAEILDIPVGTIKSRMFHASKLLAEALKHLKG